MDWERAIERNKLPLMRIVLSLLSLMVSNSLPGDGLIVPRHIWRKVLFVLRPAEAAVRRLIIIAARGLAPIAFCPRAQPASRSAFATIAQKPVPIAPTFKLVEPLKAFRFGEEEDDCAQRGVGDGAHFDRDETPVNAVHLHYRLRALSHALTDLDSQARRLARFQGRSDAAKTANQPARMFIIRPGLPPGWRERIRHDVDPVLHECHRLVRYLSDTS